ncbi:hypothetical protein [Lacrimispora sp.]|uniref:hypothetical protein n=1 Tax=Lacrimispora sp. TaxID=2719234 RepID=UPI0028AFEF18|nr:hypothetical protein [Lacrimispora sp.]
MTKPDNLPKIVDGIFICPSPYEIFKESDYNFFSDETVIKNSSFFAKMFDTVSELRSNLKHIAYRTPEFINLIKSCIPEEMITVILTDEQKQKIAEGALEFANKKSDGSIIAILRDPNTKKYVSQVTLDAKKLTPELNAAISNFGMQLQMSDIMKSLEKIQNSVNNVLTDLKDDRLALSDSNKAKFEQCMRIKNIDLQKDILIRVIMDSEDIRNRIMKDLSREIKFIQDQPENILFKIIKGANITELDSRMQRIRIDISEINQLSCIEAACYHALNENEAMLESINYYSQYLTSNFTPSIIERLHSYDGSGNDYWLNEFPNFSKQLLKLETFSSISLVGGDKDVKLQEV